VLLRDAPSKGVCPPAVHRQGCHRPTSETELGFRRRCRPIGVVERKLLWDLDKYPPPRFRHPVLPCADGRRRSREGVAAVGAQVNTADWVISRRAVHRGSRQPRRATVGACRALTQGPAACPPLATPYRRSHSPLDISPRNRHRSPDRCPPLPASRVRRPHDRGGVERAPRRTEYRVRPPTLRLSRPDLQNPTAS